MTSLEDRLQDTEIALYTALRALQAQGGSVSVSELLNEHIPTASMPQCSKAEKQREWKRQPLWTSEDFVMWCEDQHQRFQTLPSTRLEAPFRGDKVEQTSAETSAVPTTSGMQDEHLSARAHPLSMPSEAVIQQLRHCQPPTVPNGTMAATHLGAWYDNYF
jgi:hypothetical protein